MAEIRTRRSVLGGKIEVTPGTPETLAGTDANNLPMDLKFDLEAPLFERKIFDNSISQFQPIVGTRKATVTMKLELKGSGTAGTAPALGKFLKACGMTETVVAVTSVTYAPNTDSPQPSLTIGMYRDGLRKQAAGCRGTFKYSAKNGEPGMLEFTFQGLYDGVTDQTILVPSGVETTVPRPLLSALFQFHAFAGKIASIDFDMNNTVAMREDANTASGFIGALITSRDAKGTITPEEELVATLDWYGRMLAGTAGNFTFKHPGSAGNIVTTTCPAAIITKVTEQDRNGLAALGVDFALVRSVAAGNDEMSIAFT